MFAAWTLQPRGDPRRIGGHGPLPTELGAIDRVLACSLPSSWGFVLGPVNGNLGAVEAHDLVVGADRLVSDGVEDAGVDPLVPALARCRI